MSANSRWQDNPVLVYHPVLNPPPENAQSVLCPPPPHPPVPFSCSLSTGSSLLTSHYDDCSSSPQTHGTSAPQCHCRVLPTQLYLVDRQMRREAVEVFYSNAHFDLHGDNLSSSLSFLRDVLPRDGLSRLRRLEFTWTEAQCEGWADGAVASGYPAALLERVAKPSWGGGPPPKFDYKNDWRAVVAFLGAHADLPRLSITLDMEECAWSFVYDTLMWEDTPDLSMFRFIYDFYIDIATALCSLKGIGRVNLKLGAFQQLRPWLEREVLGYEQERSLQSLEAKTLEENLWQRVPPWHDLNCRLKGSNYHPDP